MRLEGGTFLYVGYVKMRTHASYVLVLGVFSFDLTSNTLDRFQWLVVRIHRLTYTEKRKQFVPLNQSDKGALSFFAVGGLVGTSLDMRNVLLRWCSRVDLAAKEGIGNVFGYSILKVCAALWSYGVCVCVYTFVLLIHKKGFVALSLGWTRAWMNSRRRKRTK